MQQIDLHALARVTGGADEDSGESSGESSRESSGDSSGQNEPWYAGAASRVVNAASGLFYPKGDKPDSDVYYKAPGGLRG
jgi:hypothetical protein